MILLDTVNRSLELKLAGTVTTNQLPFVTSYIDVSQSTFAVSGVPTNTGASNNTTAVTLVAAPAASTSRQLKFLSVKNADTAAATVIIQYNDNATIREIGRFTLAVNDTLQFIDGEGFNVIDTDGRIKQSAGSVNLTTQVSGILPIANGGTAANTAAGARTSLGLDTMATQAASAVAITGGTINNTSVNGLNSGQLAGNRNKIINGDMRISQRGTSFANPADGDYILDRWKQYKAAASSATITYSQDTTIFPTGFDSSLKALLTATDTSIAAGEYGTIEQRIEGNNIVGLNFGNASAKTLTLSFWVRSSKTGIFCVAFKNSAIDRNYISEYTISAANTWELKTITFTADTTGTWLTTNGIGLTVSWSLFMGSTYHGTANTWQAGNFYSTSNQVNWANDASATFYLTGVQLEIGSTATPFEFRINELQLCQRYLPNFIFGNSNNGFIGVATSTTASYLFLPLKVTPRAIPTGIVSSGATHLTVNTLSASGASTNVSFYSLTGIDEGAIYITTTAGSPTITTGQSVIVYGNNAASQIYFTGCEL